MRCAITSRRDDDDHDDQRDNVESRPSAVDLSDPPRRERRHDAMDNHQQNRKKEDLWLYQHVYEHLATPHVPGSL